MAQARPYYPPQSSYQPSGNSPPQEISPPTQPPPQPSYYVPPPQRPYPSQQYHPPPQHHSIAPSHPSSQARPIPRYEQQYHPTIDARNDYPDDDFYSDVEYEDGIDDGYHDNDDGLGDVTKESEKSLSYVWLYIIGMLTCLTIEVITVILSYFLDIVIVAPLMCSIWVFAVILVLCTMASSATSTSTSKHQRSSHVRTQVMSTFLMACAVGIICGLVASVSLKQAWYYEAGNYYTQVNPTAPATQYPNAVTTDYAKGSYVGKDYTGMVTSGGTRYCAAPIMGSGPGTKGTPISFWAVDTNCCTNTGTGVASPGHITATCAHWSDTTLEGEIIRNPSDSYISAAFASNTWYKSTSSDGVYYVELLSQGEHDKRQQKRRLTGYLLVALAPICWPVILIFYALFVWIGTCCCGKKNQPTTTRY